MKTKERKGIYTLGAIVLAVVVLLLSLFFGSGLQQAENKNPSPENSSTSQSSSQMQQSSSGAGLGGGGGESGGGGGGGGGKKVLFKITADQTQRLYLRQDSKGSYTGNGEHGFVGDRKYYLENATDQNPLYYFGLSMENDRQNSNRAEIELVSLTNDLLPYAPIYKTGGANEKVYSVEYYPYNYAATGVNGITPFIEQSTAYTQQELRYRQFVENEYLSIQPSLKTLLLNLAEENNLDASSPNIITDVALYIQDAAYYDYTYAENNYPADKDMVTYFLTEHKRGVCRHFAAAATMMFRALGIPARYTIGFAVDVEKDVTLEYTGDGHAWTEVYLNGYGWVAVEVTGGRLYKGEVIE